jgi:hypothetical protein
MKYFKKYEKTKMMPELLDLQKKEKQKVKTFMPKYLSKYLEKTEIIVKRLKKEMDNFDFYLQKTIQSTFAISEIFAELYNQKALLESKISKRFDSLKEIFSNSNKFFINLGTF